MRYRSFIDKEKSGEEGHTKQGLSSCFFECLGTVKRSLQDAIHADCAHLLTTLMMIELRVSRHHCYHIQNKHSMLAQMDLKKK